MPLKLRYPFIFLFLWGATTLGAQNQRVQEKELEDQSAFIEAGQARILGHPEKAEPILRDLKRRHPKDPGIAYALADLLASNEAYPGALTEIRIARQLDPENTWYAVREAEILEKTGRFAEAAGVYGGLSAAHPKEEDYYTEWAYLLIKGGDPEGALDVYDKMDSELGFHEDTRRKTYMLLRGMGRNREAADVLREVIRRQPDNTEVMLLLAEFLENQGDSMEARDLYVQVLNRHPGETSAQLALVRLQASSDPSGPLAVLAPVFRDPQAGIDPKVKALIPHIQAFADNGDPVLGKVLDSLTSILDIVHPGDPKVSSIRGDLAFYRGDFDLAIRAYRDALDREPAILAIWDQLLLATSEARRYTDQVRFSEQALDVFPNQAGIHVSLAEGLLETFRPEDALDEIRLARLMARNDGIRLYQLAVLEGRALTMIGRRQDALLAFDQALALHPDSPEALAWRSLTSRDPHRCCIDARAAAGHARQASLVRAALAECAFQSGQIGEARQQLEDLLAGEPHPRAEWVERLGDACSLLGDTGRAASCWQQARELGRRTESLDRKIASRKYEE